jgi:hypothetical protein
MRKTLVTLLVSLAALLVVPVGPAAGDPAAPGGRAAVDQARIWFYWGDSFCPDRLLYVELTAGYANQVATGGQPGYFAGVYAAYYNCTSDPDAMVLTGAVTPAEGQYGIVKLTSAFLNEVTIPVENEFGFHQSFTVSANWTGGGEPSKWIVMNDTLLPPQGPKGRPAPLGPGVRAVSRWVGAQVTATATAMPNISLTEANVPFAEIHDIHQTVTPNQAN